MNSERQSFDEWFAELKRIGRSKFGFNDATIASMTGDGWRDYFDGGYTPLDALKEDFSYD